MPQESSPAIAALVKALEALPGYGPRSAQRAAFFLLSPKRRGELQALRQALADAETKVASLSALPHLVRRGGLRNLRRSVKRRVAALRSRNRPGSDGTRKVAQLAGALLHSRGAAFAHG